MKETDTIIHLKNVYANYGLFNALKEINLDIKQNENWVILGANGSGKSTLMKLFLNDIYPNINYEFKKNIFGKEKWDIFELKKLFGIITNDLHTQFMTLGKFSTVEEAILSGYYSGLGVFKHHKYTEEQFQKIDEIMKNLNIYEIRNKTIDKISTGQLRRTIIGRALVHDPKIFVLDEPTVGLDIKAQTSFIDLIRKLAKNYPIILITHQVEEIFPEITHVALMKDGRIFKQGKKEDILTSSNLSETFDMEINLDSKDGRYYITSAKLS